MKRKDRIVSAREVLLANRDDPDSYLKNYYWDTKNNVWKQRGLK